MINYIADDSGAVTSPKLHDATLICIEISDAFIQLSFKLVSDKIVHCKLVSVDQFLCNGLRKGNIVLDLTIVRGKALHQNISKKLFEPPRNDNERFRQYLDSINEKLINGDLTLVILNPTYGGEIISLCREIIFEN